MSKLIELQKADSNISIKLVIKLIKRYYKKKILIDELKAKLALKDKIIDELREKTFEFEYM